MEELITILAISVFQFFIARNQQQNSNKIIEEHKKLSSHIEVLKRQGTQRQECQSCLNNIQRSSSSQEAVDYKYVQESLSQLLVHVQQIDRQINKKNPSVSHKNHHVPHEDRGSTIENLFVREESSSELMLNQEERRSRSSTNNSNELTIPHKHKRKRSYSPIIIRGNPRINAGSDYKQNYQYEQMSPMIQLKKDQKIKYIITDEQSPRTMKHHRNQTESEFVFANINGYKERTSHSKFRMKKRSSNSLNL